MSDKGQEPEPEVATKKTKLNGKDVGAKAKAPPAPEAAPAAEPPPPPAEPKHHKTAPIDDIIDEFDFSYIPDELKDLICGPGAGGSIDVLTEATAGGLGGKTGAHAKAAHVKHDKAGGAGGEKSNKHGRRRGQRDGEEEEDEDESEGGDEDESGEDSSSFSEDDEEEEEGSSGFTPSDEDFPLDELDSDEEDSDNPEERKKRRFLLGSHSFLQLKDPGLDDALVPKEQLPETEKMGKHLDKKHYLDFCKELGIQPLKKFLNLMHTDAVDLNRYFLCPEEIIAICKMMENNTTVKYLNLSGNLAGLEGGLAIAKMIENNYTLTHLSIGAMEILPAFKKICEAVALNITLEYLDISRNELGDREMQWVSNFLKESTTLKELYLSRNKIRDQGASYLGMGLKENQSLEILDLAINEMRGEKPCGVLFHNAADHPTLKHINLFNNTLKDVVAKGISRVLSNNKQMEFIDVAFNIFDNPGARTIGKGFWNAQAMVKLNAGPNEWRQDGAAAILSPLTSQKFNAPMELIDFGWLFDVYKQFIKVEEKVLKLHPEPEVKIIRGNAFGQWKAKGPDAKALVIHRARVVCENFTTPLEMLIDELRTEPKKMNHKDFKKFIKSCNLYKDKSLTEGFLHTFALTPFEVDCESIIATYDRVYPKKKSTDKSDAEGQEGENGTNVNSAKEMKKERDTSIHLMKW